MSETLRLPCRVCEEGHSVVNDFQMRGNTNNVKLISVPRVLSIVRLFVMVCNPSLPKAAARWSSSDVPK